MHRPMPQATPHPLLLSIGQSCFAKYASFMRHAHLCSSQVGCFLCQLRRLPGNRRGLILGTWAQPCPLRCAGLQAQVPAASTSIKAAELPSYTLCRRRHMINHGGLERLKGSMPSMSTGAVFTCQFVDAAP